MAILALQVIVFLHLLGGAVGQPNSRAVLSTSSLTRVVVSRMTGDVFLADQHTVYLLPGDLSEITNNVSRTAGQTPEGMTLSKQEDKLIVCWASATPIGGGSTINDAPCVVYNSTDLLQTLQTVSGDSSVRVGAARGNPYSVSQGFVEDEGETFYVMSADANNLYHREYRIPDRERASETPSYAGIVDRRYMSGATVGNFSYFATYSFLDRVAVVQVVRVCNIKPNPNDSLWESWYEIQVICDLPPNLSALSDFDNVLVDADFLFPDSGADGPLLVVSVLTDVVSTPSAFCVVPLSAVDTSARNMFNYCATNTLSINQLQFPWGNDVGACNTADNDLVNITECDLRVAVGPFSIGPGRLATQLLSPLPGFEVIQRLQPFLSLSTRVSSSEVFLVDDLVVIFTGYSNGQVRKYATRNFSDTNTNPAPERTWSLSSKEVKALSHASGSDYVYALTEDEVQRLPVEECSNFTDCSACITNGGLLCGWCSVENKCSRRPQCANSNSSDGLRWAQTTDRCLTADIAGEEIAYPIETKSIGQWTKVPGGLKHVTASVNYIWGVNNNDHIFICDNPCNGNWRHISGALKQIDAGDMEVWGVNNVDDIYKRPVDGSGAWTHIGGKLKHVSASGNGWIWGVNSADQIYKCKKPCNGAWIHVEGRLKQIDGGEKYVYGVNSRDNIYAKNIDGSGSWRHIPGKLSHISASGSDEVFGVNRAGVMYRCKKPCVGTEWEAMLGELKQCDAAPGVVYGVDSATGIWRRVVGY